MNRASVLLVRVAAVALAALACVCPSPAVLAQPFEQPALSPLTNALKRIKDTRTVRLGVREAAVPFSTINAAGQASGYSVDLCLAIVDDIAATLGVGALRVEYRKVTTTDRLEQVTEGRVDLECGATTNTAERRERVAFSPPIFIAGTRLMVKRGSPVRSVRDLQGLSVVVVRGTTNEAVIRQWAAARAPRLRIEVVEGYEAALAQLDRGGVAALAADDVLIAGLIADRGQRNRYAMVGEPLSYEPYGIVLPRDDPALGAVVLGTFTRLSTSGEIRSIYNKWFTRPLPTGERLDWPMSVQLARTFEILGLPPE